MTRILATVSAGLLAVVLAQPAAAAPTIDDAKALVVKAAAVLKADGLEKACPVFNDRSGDYWKENGELYVFVINFQGAWDCYPPKPAGVGTNLIDLKDVDGKELVKEMIDVARTKGEGWVEYQWKNPATNKIQPKATYVQRVGDGFVASGVYK